jgi:hypothetical protein
MTIIEQAKKLLHDLWYDPFWFKVFMLLMLAFSMSQALVFRPDNVPWAVIGLSDSYVEARECATYKNVITLVKSGCAVTCEKTFNKTPSSLVLPS